DLNTSRQGRPGSARNRLRDPSQRETRVAPSFAAPTHVIHASVVNTQLHACRVPRPAEPQGAHRAPIASYTLSILARLALCLSLGLAYFRSLSALLGCQRPLRRHTLSLFLCCRRGVLFGDLALAPRDEWRSRG